MFHIALQAVKLHATLSEVYLGHALRACYRKAGQNSVLQKECIQLIFLTQKCLPMQTQKQYKVQQIDNNT